MKCGVPAHVIVFLKNIAGFLYLDLLKEPPKRSKSAIDSPNIGFPIGKHKKIIFSKSKYTKLFGFVNQECWTATYWRNLCVARDQTQTPPMTPLAQESHMRLFPECRVAMHSNVVNPIINNPQHYQKRGICGINHRQIVGISLGLHGFTTFQMLQSC